MASASTVQSYVSGSNPSGQLIGALQITSPGPFQAFRTIPAASQIPSVSSLGTLGGQSTFSSYTRRINRLGDCVGESQVSASPTINRGFVCLSGQASLTSATSIAPFDNSASHNSYALGINDVREVVGKAQVASGNFRAFLYTPNQIMRDLNSLAGSSSWVFQEAIAINNNGVIVGNGSYSGNARGYMLIPTP
jgi:probable HAF family extracellular repeat protein